MKNEHLGFRPELVKKSISYCVKEDCSVKGQCLHYLAFDKEKDFLIEAYFINPHKVQGNAQCVKFLSNKVQRVGRGFRRALAQVPYGKIRRVRSQIQDLLSCCYSRYYKYASGDVPLRSDQVEDIQAFFVAYGLSPDEIFDAYEDTYHLD